VGRGPREQDPHARSQGTPGTQDRTCGSRDSGRCLGTPDGDTRGGCALTFCGMIAEGRIGEGAAFCSPPQSEQEPYCSGMKASASFGLSGITSCLWMES